MAGIWGVNAMLLRNYFQGLRILGELHLCFRDPGELAERMRLGDRFTVEAPRALVARYERLIEEAKENTRKHAPALLPFRDLQIILFGVRLLAVAVAFAGFPCLAMLTSTLQYVIAPCSFFVSLTMFIALAPPLFLGHYAVWSGLQGLSAALLPWWLRPSVPINMPFILLVLGLDQGLCVWLTQKTPTGPAEAVPPSTLFKHCWYGFLNCKTYELLILLCARAFGCRVDLAVWLLDARFGLSARAAAFLEGRCGTWAFLFYTQHRMGHLPKVYDSAHKFHHTFRDSTAFDAHIYGSGMPEELFCIFAEVLGAGLGLCPMSLGPNGLKQSWANKLGHTRKKDGAGGLNEHADHHKEHTKNYGISNPMLDMLFCTRCDNDRAEYGEWEVLKKQEEEVVRFEWQTNPKTKGQDVWKSYYDPSLTKDMAEVVLDVWGRLKKCSSLAAA
mmetsp:Transcript_4123/g.12916  ORF Transcript_4123/g.12916 Transcript_4123/m.12916 type:complete len:444 (-) Transcript_4123:89-1420(-)